MIHSAAARFGLRAPVFFRGAAPGLLRGPLLSRATVTNNAAGPTTAKDATTANLTWLEREVNAVAFSEAAELDLLRKEIFRMKVELAKARADHEANLHACKLQVWENSSAIALAGGCFILVALYLI